MVISHNLPAINTQRQYSIVGKMKEKHTEKLSSGYKINRAADDAAGLAISEKMRRQIRGLNRGIANAQDGISLCQVADGALNEVHDIIQRLNELAVQASNGTYSYSDRSAIQDEVGQLLTEIDRISETTKFNERRLFVGESERTVTLTSSTSSASSTKPTGGTSQTYPPLPTGVWVDYGNFSILTAGQHGTDFEYDSTTHLLTIKSEEKIYIKDKQGSTVNNTTDRIRVEYGKGADIVLAGVNINASDAAFMIADNSSGNVKVTLYGNNSLISGSKCAGLQKNSSNEDSGWLTIDGPGQLVAQGDAGGAGIGSNGTGAGVSRNIRISGGTVIAKGGNAAAGIGGGRGWSGVDIEIDGGIVEAIGGANGAGIGGGNAAAGIRIRISGGTVTAKSVGGGAGIGGGSNSFCNGITISGGTVTAEGGSNAAGIGGGRGSGGINMGDITISNSIVKATGKDGAQNIGGGNGAAAASNNKYKIGTTEYTSGTNGKATFVAAGDTCALIANNADAVDVNQFTLDGNKVTSNQDLEVSQGMEMKVTDGFTLEVKKDADSATLTNKGTVENRGEMVVYGAYNIEGGTHIGNEVILGKPDTDTEAADSSSSKNVATIRPDGRLWIQTGNDAKDGMYIDIDVMNTKVLGLTGLNLTQYSEVSLWKEMEPVQDEDESEDDYKKRKAEWAKRDAVRKAEWAEYARTHAITKIEGALTYISRMRSKIGAQQNRLEHTIANESNIVENTTAAESRIRDVDMAEEMVAFSLSSIVAQAGEAMLTQANTSNEGVMALLR